MTYRFLTSRLLAVAIVGFAYAGAAGAAPKAAGSMDPQQVETIRQAIAESRLLDAGRMIDEAGAAGVADPRLRILSGELGLARKRFPEALGDFKAAEASADPQVRGEALQGHGLALISMERHDAAFPLLQQAVAAAPQNWRAWNALGSLYDRKRDWSSAEAAYSKALDASGQHASVLNNRGYSRMLQGRLADAKADFVAALQKRPDLAEARNNLRLTLALEGDYDRAVAGARLGEEAALLNNAGFAAAARGDYVTAEQLLQQAMKARGEFYARASGNLKLIQTEAPASPR